MNRFEQYMTDRSVENALPAERKLEMIDNFLFGIASSKMEGAIYAEDEEEFLLYCVLNNISNNEMLNAIFEVKGFPPLNHEVAEQSRMAYELYKKSLAQ